MRRFTAIVLAGFACLAAPATGWAAEGGGANNVVMVSTTADGSEQARSGLQVASVGGPNVTSTNLANARATNCTGCHSGAAAIQAVFVTRNASFQTPTNAAVATNGGCSECVSFAYAFQYVLSTDGPVRMTTEGRQALQDLRQRFQSTLDSGLPNIHTKEDADELRDDLDAIANQFKTTIDEMHVSVGPGVVHQEVKTALGPSSTDTTSTPTSTDPTTSGQTSTPTTDATSGTSGTDGSSTGTSGTDTSGAGTSDTSGTNTSGTDTSGTDTTGASGTDQTSGSDSASTAQQSSTSAP
jgi:putative peptide zinc metalloprotease protein